MPTIDHSSRLLRWFGWRRLLVARPAMAETANQSPSGASGANTWTRPMALQAMPATTRATQKARKAWSPRPTRSADAATATTRIALRIVPADDSDSAHGTAAQSDAASAARKTMASAASSAWLPRDWGRASRGSQVASTSRKPPQPTNAAAWLKNVAEGATLKAMRVGKATARLASAAHGTRDDLAVRADDSEEAIHRKITDDARSGFFHYSDPASAAR